MNKPNLKTITIAAAALFAGLAVGVAAQPAPAEPVAVAPQIRTVTPPECLQALDAADQLIGTGADALAVAGDVIGLMPAALDAAMAWDATTLEDIAGQIGDKNADMTRLNGQVELDRDEYTTAASACRANR